MPEGRKELIRLFIHDERSATLGIYVTSISWRESKSMSGPSRPWNHRNEPSTATLPS